MNEWDPKPKIGGWWRENWWPENEWDPKPKIGGWWPENWWPQNWWIENE